MVIWQISVDETTAYNVSGVEPLSVTVTNGQTLSYLVGV